ITDHVLARLSPEVGTSTERVLRDIAAPVAKQRLISYLLAASLGLRWARSVSDDLQREVSVRFNQVEADRLFGPWIGAEMQVLTEACGALLVPDAPPLRTWSPADPPSDAIALAAEALPALDATQRSDRENQDLVVADFCRAFLRLYERRELPAREEVHRLGAD